MTIADGTDPGIDRSVLWLGLALVGWIALLRWPFFLYQPTGYDEGLYLAAAVRMLAGARLYTDVWDNKPVGIYLVYVAIAATLGSSRFALNLASALAVLGSACLVYLIGRDAAGRRAGIIAAVSWPGMSAGPVAPSGANVSDRCSTPPARARPTSAGSPGRNRSDIPPAVATAP